MSSRLTGHALVVHLFAAVEGDRAADQLDVLRRLWCTCAGRLEMAEPVAGLPLDPGPDWQRARLGLLAAGSRPGPGVHQAVLRRLHDTVCLSVVLQAAPGNGTWREADREWTVSVASSARMPGRPVTELLGSVRLFLAHLAEPLPAPPTPDADLVRESLPADPAAAPQWPERGAAVPGGRAVWEASAPADDRVERRVAVVAAASGEAALSVWAWSGAGRELPPLARYFLHAAKLRYELRVWADAREGCRGLRRATDGMVAELVATVGLATPPGRGPAHAALLKASGDLDVLQAHNLRLLDRASRLREMQRTTEIAADNLRALAGVGRAGDDDPPGGLFAEDRELAEWLGRQLDDDAGYLETALHRSEQVATLLGELVLRSRQRRQEGVNLGLTGVVGAIVMSLAAVQSLQYTLPLPGPVKPAVVTALSAVALLASLLVLRAVVPERRWTLRVVQAGAGAVGAALAWVLVAAVAGAGAGPSVVWPAALTGCVFAVSTAAVLRAHAGRQARRARRRSLNPPGASGH